MSEKNVTLVSKDGESSVTLNPETDAVDVTQFRAMGWGTKTEQTTAAKIESKQESAK